MKHNNHLRILLLAALSFVAVTFTQSVILPQSIMAQDPGRASSTKIVDALNQLPAQNEELFNRLMEDIVSTGREGVDMLISILEKKDDSMVRAEYALDGLSAYASAENFDSEKRKVIIAAFEKALLKLKGSDNEKIDEDLRQFYSKQLKRLGVITAEKEENIPAITPKEALKLLSAATKAAKKDPSELNIAKRCLALRQYLAADGIVNGEKVIFKALGDPCREYRFAALYAMDHEDPSVLYDGITALLPDLDDNSKADVIWWLGEKKDPYNSEAILPYLESNNQTLLQSAAWALTKLQSEQAMKEIAKYLTSSDSFLVSLSEECLKSSAGDVPSEIVPLYQEARPKGKTAILNILAMRKSAKNAAVVFEALNSEEQTVTDAAYAALKDVVSVNDLSRLYALLESTGAAREDAVRDAILAASSQETGRYLIFTRQQAQAKPEVQNRYTPLIIRTAGLDELFTLCSTHDEAIEAYIAAIKKSDAPGAEKLLLLRKAFGVAKTEEQKKEIITAVGYTDTFLGLLFAGEFLEEPALKQESAHAVMRIALAHPEFYGPKVSALLRHTCEVLAGPDAEYEKTAIRKHIAELPTEGGFVPMFDGKTLEGWKGLVENPFVRAKMKPAALAKAQKEADARMAENWKVEDGCITYEGSGYDNLCTVKDYGDFEMYIDWKLYPGPEADAGIYLRGTPQVQIWDIARTNVGAEVGSGGLYNNTMNPSKPPQVADNAVGEWNSFHIKMTGERVTVQLNGITVVDNVILENYWDRSYPIFPTGQIELQAHGSKVAYRNLYIRELEQVKPYELSAEEKSEGFELLFDGTSLQKWQGNTVDYNTVDGNIEVSPTGQGFGNLYTDEEYSDFIFRFEFKLTPGANNGVGIRTPTEGDAAYVGMEIQILDHFDAIYQPELRDYQYHGSVYGIIPAQVRTAFKPIGEWNTEEIYAKGNHIRVTVNGIVITEGDIAEATKNGTYDGNEHPGLFNKSGHIGFLGHGSQLWLRNIRVKRL